MKTTVQHVADGATVYVSGHSMIVSDLRVYTDKDGEQFVRFVGSCTADSRNDDIRGTTYDGGRYGGNRLVYAW